ncbi:MAG: N-methyl-L-tryptophan oxidase [Planctomycetota bacterium]
MTQEPVYDAIVVGLGAMGSAALYQLSKRGARVLGIDQYSPPHTLGSSHGDTRLTRCAIGEGSHYVPLAVRSHEIWRELEERSGETVLTECGGLFFSGEKQVSPVHGTTAFLDQTIAAAKQHGIEHELLDLAALEQRFPQFKYSGIECGYYEPGAGFVRPERAIDLQLRFAVEQGAEVMRDTAVVAVEPASTQAGLSRVTTADAEFAAKRVILTAGAWVSQFLDPAVHEQFAVYRQLLFWFEPDMDIGRFEPAEFPVYIRSDRTKEDLIYGFPAIDGIKGGIKIASEQYASTCTPEAGTAPVTQAEIDRMFALASRFLKIKNHCYRAAACLFTVTPDGEFTIDFHPDHPDLIVASPCSGHGFKHSAAIGEMLAELALDGQTHFDRTEYRMDRFH